MKYSEQRLKWLIEEFLEALTLEDVGSSLEEPRLKDWQVLKFADDIKEQFIGGDPEWQWFVRPEKSGNEPIRLAEIPIDVDLLRELRKEAGKAIGQFTERGMAYK